MDVSPNALRKETAALFRQINEELEEGAPKEQYIQLLLAKSQCLQTLTLLNEQGRRK